MKLLFASTNVNKIAEVKSLMPNHEILSLLDFPKINDVDETEMTLEGNALKKAKEIAMQVNMPVFADDSGLFIEALNGAPGVHSARWTGTHRDYGTQNQKVLDLLKNETNRKAYYETVISFVVPDNNGNYINVFYKGKMPLEIATEESTTKGFSYDSIAKYNGKYVSEMTSAEKNAVSSRAKAIEKFNKLLG